MRDRELRSFLWIRVAFWVGMALTLLWRTVVLTVFAATAAAAAVTFSRKVWVA